MKHVVLVKMFQNRITKVQYIESKFDREPGDVMVYDGDRMNVGIVGDSKKVVIDKINEFIKLQNREVNRKKYQEKKETDKMFNDILKEAWKSINEEL